MRKEEELAGGLGFKLFAALVQPVVVADARAHPRVFTEEVQGWRGIFYPKRLVNAPVIAALTKMCKVALKALAECLPALHRLQRRPNGRPALVGEGLKGGGRCAEEPPNLPEFVVSLCRFARQARQQDGDIIGAEAPEDLAAEGAKLADGAEHREEDGEVQVPQVAGPLPHVA